MITVDEASRIILENTIPTGKETISFANGTGRILREDLKADRDFPPFDRVMMDGIAIRYEDYKKGNRKFYVEGIQAAGQEQQEIKKANRCMEVMTGAVLPIGTDTVIRYEDLQIRDGQAQLLVEDIQQAQNVHKKGTDRKKDEVIVKQGGILTPSEIGVAAAIGKVILSVSQLPSIAVVSTGDELVKVAIKPQNHQIRRSNVYTLEAGLRAYQIKPELVHISDDREQLHRYLLYCLENFDVIILSGGASRGKFDYVPESLERLGVQRLFYKVKQRPGKPFWFGKKGDSTVVFALPGNPVSSFCCFHRYFVPWLRASFGLSAFNPMRAVLTEDFTFEPELQYFLQVKTNFTDKGELAATPIVGHGSGDFANLVDTDGFLELPAEKTEFKKGEAYSFIPYK